ncbi:LysR family transcriptional regulator [Flavobacterium sp. CSZ]|uniref:LysR family transcriptional regulator n=1 Tax=Flavobacterium sp. CSZ TaxID=2783791 RepID=UPI00188A0BDF|nr:LysR family transcriptional regulator [Flavobacterium sp. CSZ]MBF4485729.1 LysR family transcriptional regulator [Flavobacterium sp. CSZ]
MNINDLKIFQAVAEHGSFTKAALTTNTVQSNVTARIKYLEEYFNAKLFIRSTRKIELTEEGLLVLKAAKELQVILDKTKSSIGKTLLSLKGTVKIGCLHSTAALRIPSILRSFTNTYPDIEFRLKTGITSDLIKEVLSFKLDGAFISGDIENNLLDTKHVVMEELCIVASSITKSLEQLSKIDKPLKLIVFNKGCAYRELLIGILKEMDIDKYKIIEVDTLEGIVNSVEDGIGITLLPLELIKKNYSYRGLTTFLPPQKFSKCPTFFIKRTDFPMNEGYTLFIESIINSYSQNTQ